MKFFLNNAISINQIGNAIHIYLQKNEGQMPSYLLIHPETRHKLIVGDAANEKGINYKYVHLYHSPIPEEGLRSTEKVFDLWILQSYDVEPGFMIICG